MTQPPNERPAPRALDAAARGAAAAAVGPARYRADAVPVAARTSSSRSRTSSRTASNSRHRPAGHHRLHPAARAGAEAARAADRVGRRGGGHRRRRRDHLCRPLRQLRQRSRLAQGRRAERGRPTWRTPTSWACSTTWRPASATRSPARCARTSSSSRTCTSSTTAPTRARWPASTFHVQNLTYGAKPIVVNDHVQIVAGHRRHDRHDRRHQQAPVHRSVPVDGPRPRPRRRPST